MDEKSNIEENAFYKAIYETLGKDHVLNRELVYIVADVHEKSKIPKLLDDKKKCLVFKAPLKNADYLYCSFAGTELKRGLDFGQSVLSKNLVNHSLHDQMIRAKQALGNVNLIIQNYEKNEFFYRNDQTKLKRLKNEYLRCISSYKTILTHSDEETAQLIYDLGRLYQRHPEQVEYSRSISKSFTLEKRREYLIQGCFNTGSKTSKTLMNVYKTPDNFFRALENTFCIHTKSGKPKGIVGPLKEIKGISYKYVKENKKIIFGEENGK